MTRFRIGDKANGAETSEQIIDANSEVEALQKLVDDSNLYCEEIEVETGDAAQTASQTLRAWSFTLTERNGEQEYSYEYLVYAETQAQADEIAHKHASNWYDNTNELEPYDKDTDTFSFLGGCIEVKISPCRETDADEFARALADRYTIGYPDEETSAPFRITTIEQLKAFASSAIGGLHCYILLNGGARSEKLITYNHDEKIFAVTNHIDNSLQKLTEAEIVDPKQTNIGEAMAKGALIAD